MLERLFKLSENKTRARTEALAGISWLTYTFAIVLVLYFLFCAQPNGLAQPRSGFLRLRSQRERRCSC